MAFFERLSHAWNAFSSKEIAEESIEPSGESTSFGGRYTPHRYISISNERSIISSIFVRLGIDVASLEMRHVRKDEAGRYLEDINSGLNNCLQVSANVDQPARAFRQDIAMTLFEEGVAVVVPVDTTLDPTKSTSYEIETLRVGTVVKWFPQHVKVRLYDDRKGRHQDIVVEKTYAAVIENPLYSVMNEPNGTLKRLMRKLAILDAIDEQSGSGKLDLIIQLPYTIKSEARRQQAEQRRKDIEFQLKGSQYGIAFTDGTEKITQLNRPAENQLLKQVDYLTKMLYAQLGITEEVMNGTADEATMINYYNRTIEPVTAAIVEAMHRTFLTKTARTQRQAIVYLNDPFKLVPVSEIAEIADKFTRNEILSSNEIRSILGIRPSSDPKADELRNSNMPSDGSSVPEPPVYKQPSVRRGSTARKQERISQNGS